MSEKSQLSPPKFCDRLKRRMVSCAVIITLDIEIKGIPRALFIIEKIPWLAG